MCVCVYWFCFSGEPSGEPLWLPQPTALKESPGYSSERESPESAVLLSEGDRIQNSERPGKLDLTGQSARKVSALGEKASETAVSPGTLLIHELVSVPGASPGGRIFTDCDS